MSQGASSTRRTTDRVWYAHILARYARERRAQLGLTVERAAELSGMQLCEWAAMEDGWVPAESMIRAIAETLEVRWPDLHLLAFFARSAQQHVA
ncbi:MAG TPA: hypothetical protein VF135_07025 [Terriglobales bacterium]